MAQNFSITGKSMWCKLFGAPQPNYKEDGNEWSVEIIPDEKSTNLLQRLGLGDRINANKNNQMVFRRPAKKKTPGKDGRLENKPVPVVDEDGNPWPDNVSVGNGSTIKIKFGIIEIPPKAKFKGGLKSVIYEMQVLDLVPYNRPAHTISDADELPVDANVAEKWNG